MNEITVALIAGGSSLITAFLTIAVNAWLGSRKATNDDARLGLDALKEGLSSALATANRLTAKLTALETRATLVLSENNRFRTLHGQDLAHSLETFEPLPEECWRDFQKK